MGARGSVDVADDTFVVAAPRTVAAALGDRSAWRGWWPDLELTVTRDRGLRGVQWRVSGAVVGTMELWLEPWGDGVLVHHYLRGEVADGGGPALGRRSGRGDRVARRHVLRWKQVVHGLKDALEHGRGPGTSREVKDPAEPAEVPVREQSHVSRLRRPRPR